MKLYEFEGHQILAKAGIDSPFFIVCSNLDEIKQARRRLKFPIVAKVQVLSGRRGKSGGVKVCTTEKQLLAFAKQHFGQKFPQPEGEEVRFIQLSQKVEIKSEAYISITYDTASKKPHLLYCAVGGVDIEEIQKRDPTAVGKLEIDPLVGPQRKDLEKVFQSISYSSSESRSFSKMTGRVEKFRLNSSRLRSNNIDNLMDFVLRLWDTFARFDCRLVEVNPLALVRTAAGSHPRGAQSQSWAYPGGGYGYMAIDAKIILDDAGLARHRDLEVLPKGAVSAIPSNREILAKQIDQDDYRGSAGSTFIELGGDIAILASGGGASLLVMDSLVAVGGWPANYTEYSGNPPAEKVEKLTKITLGKENLSGCLVCGAVANFTDIYETLRGFVDGLRQVRPKPNFPIVVRRGGPRQEEAYEMLEKVAKKEAYDIHLFGPETPISVACQEMVKLSEKFKIRERIFDKSKSENLKYESVFSINRKVKI